MKKKYLLFTLLSALILISWKTAENNWLVQKHRGYTVYYTQADKGNMKEYGKLVGHGIKSVRTFFEDSYAKEFNIVIHPDRNSLDSTWQKDWQMPDFKSECWMVASGAADKLDVISPKTWDKEACEHKYADKTGTQKVITHELFHVYHGQLNASPDFSDVEGIDWFVEGLATYASGQCDSARMAEIKKAILDNKIPSSLDNFWTGKMKYGLSGSLVMYIDHEFGREKLKELLKYNKKTEILTALNTTEPELLKAWKKYITRY